MNYRKDKVKKMSNYFYFDDDGPPSDLDGEYNSDYKSPQPVKFEDDEDEYMEINLEDLLRIKLPENRGNHFETSLVVSKEFKTVIIFKIKNCLGEIIQTITADISPSYGENKLNIINPIVNGNNSPENNVC